MADPLRATKVCDAIVVNMIDVGEETGDLDKMLIKVADNYDSDVDVLVGSLISILEPVMVVVLGVIVGNDLHRRRAVRADDAGLVADRSSVIRLLKAYHAFPSELFDDLSISYYDGQCVRDAWGSPIVFMASMNPAVGMAAKGWFFFSAGPDRKYTTKSDNLYSYELPGLDQANR
jgi:hypothetical protein